ncbi:MAG: proton-conducting transporter membrane subunit [Bryobacteraceae bacterium]
MESLLICTIAAPGLIFFALGMVWLLGWSPAERFISRLTGATYLFCTASTLVLLFQMQDRNLPSISAPLDQWFGAGKYAFASSLFMDRLSMTYVLITVILVGLIGAFSSRYLHREQGYFRFFALLHLFALGSLLIFASGSFDLLVVGWELVGITSVLLIAFFQERPEPVRGALHVFGVYRACDIGLLVAVVVLHHVAGSASYGQLLKGAWPAQTSAVTGGAATAVALLLIIAASGKSAQVPFSGWLPRAMEGPTPSSAVFYGAIAVHAGTYLLLRAQPILAASPVASFAVVVIGAITAIHGTMAGRACANAKTSLAYASLSQIGIIFVEIGFGFTWLALVHVVGHAASRTLQFLRAPSMLHDYHQMHSAAGGNLQPTGAHYESLLPAGMRRWLYRLALDRGHHDTILERFLLGGLMRVAQVLATFERLWAAPHPEAEHPGRSDALPFGWSPNADQATGAD